MRIRHFLLLCLLLSLCLLLGLSSALAQDKPPAKERPAGPFIAGEAGVLPADAFPTYTEIEPNDALDDANFISHSRWFASRVNGVINPVGDVDTYEFYGLAGDRLIMNVVADYYGSPLDSVVQLRDWQGNILVEADDYDYDNDDLDSYFDYTLPYEGEFFLTISAYADENGGPGYWYTMYFWAQERDQFYAPDQEEPNNTRAAAYPVAYGNTVPFARLGVNGDVDYFKFQGKKGDAAVIFVESTSLRGRLESRLALYNSAGTLLASCDEDDWGAIDTNCQIEKVLPADGTYFVKVSDAQNKGGADKVYWLEVGFDESFEPNDRFADATTLALGQTVRGLIAQGDFNDFFRFRAPANQTITIRMDGLEFGLYDANQNFVGTTYYCAYGLTFNQPGADAWYYIEVSPLSYMSTEGHAFGAYELTVDEMMLAGTTANVTLNGLAFTKSDILQFYPATNKWGMYFDGSDVGLTANVRDFDLIQGNQCPGGDDYYQLTNLVMSLGAKATLPGSPKITALPQDLVKFIRTFEMGDNTYGDWEMYLDGSDIGLTTAAEAIDAVDLDIRPADDDFIIFSTTGTATVRPNAGWPPFTAQDEDLIWCSAPQGWNTVVNCGLHFDGSAAGIPAAADIASAWIDHTSPSYDDIYMTFAAKTVIGGVTYLPNDVALCRAPYTSYPLDSCTWFPKHWVGNTHGLTGKFIDGLVVDMTPHS